jgi:hypothetical protein
MHPNILEAIPSVIIGKNLCGRETYEAVPNTKIHTQASTVTLEMSGLLPLLEEVDREHEGMNEPQWARMH